jgi:hypothetical protein
MDIIYVNEKIVINWTINRNASEVQEDFSRADLRVFLTGNDFDGNYDGKYYFGNRVDANGRVVIEVPANTLTPGTYCIEGVWIKNDHELINSGWTRSISRARKDRIFKVAEESEDFSSSSSEGDPSVHEINIKTGVTSYGYDGMSAYETAVFEGSTVQSEKEWIEKYEEAEDRINYEMEEDTPGTWANAELLRKRAEGQLGSSDEGWSTSREHQEDVRQANEAIRQANEETRQEQEGSPTDAASSTGSRWARYKQAEIDRNTSYASEEGSAAGSTTTSNDRWGKYKAAEAGRDSEYASAEGTASASAGDANRWGSYKTAENTRDAARLTAEGTIDSESGASNRWGQYKAQEGTPASTEDDSRWAEYNSAEDDRDTAYATAEGAATDAASATGSRWARYNKAEADRNAAYAEEEGSLAGSSAGDSDRWGQFKSAEADRNDAMAPLVGYFGCATAASTAAKEVSASDYVLTSGGSIKVKFTYANSASSPTLNINSTGAKAIVYNGAVASATNTWAAGDVVEFYYDPTYNSNAGAFVGIPTVVSVSQNTLSIGGEEVGELAGQLIENPEWVKVVTDSENKILYGVKTDGKFYFGGGCPPQVQEYVQGQIDAIGIDALLATKVDKVAGKSLINSRVADSQDAIENPEYLEVKTDSNDKVIEGITTEGRKQINIPIDTSAVSIEPIESPEWTQVLTDREDKVIAGLKADGNFYFYVPLVCKNKILTNILDYAIYVESDGLWDLAIEKALNENDSIYFPEGSYDISQPILIPRDNITIIASKNARIYKKVQQSQITHQHCRCLYAENKDNITLIGGYWDAETKVSDNELVREHSCRGTLSFYRCSRLTIRNCTIKCFRASFCIQPSSCSNVDIENIDFDNARGCGVQVGGNTNTFLISNLRGHTGDDFVALNGYDWWTSSAEFGIIQNGKVCNLYPNTATAAVRILSGINEIDGEQYIGFVRNVIVENIFGVFNRIYAVHIGFEFDLDHSGENSPLAVPDNILVRNVHCIANSGTSTPSFAIYGYAGNITFENVSDSGNGLFTFTNRAIVKHLTVRNYTAKDNTNSFNITGSTINRLTLDNITKDTNDDANNLVSINGGTINNIELNNCDIESGVSVINIDGNNTNVQKVSLNNCKVENAKIIANGSNNQVNVFVNNTILDSAAPSSGSFTQKICVYE